MRDGLQQRKRIKQRKRQKQRTVIFKVGICTVLCFMVAVLFHTAAAAEDIEKTVITLKAESTEMVQDGEIPALAAKASVKGDKSLILDEATGYSVQDLLDEFNKGKNYQLLCSADGKVDGKFPVDIELSGQIEESLVREWLGKVDVKLKGGTFVVKNKYGEWEGKKFKKTDGNFAANEFIVSKGNKYYLNENGEKLTGEHQIGIKKCVFAKDGKLISEESSIDPNKPMIALTFDDGPGEETGRILEVLEENNSRATFFMLGKNAKLYPETVKKMQEIGCELGNHTNSHPQLTKLSADQIKSEIGTTSEVVSSATGGFATTVIRPPYGAVNDTVKANAGQPLIMWSVDTLDWKTRNVQSNIDSVMGAKDGDIILMHDIHKPSVEAAVQVIPMLVSKGYQLVTVSELAEARGISMESGGKYSQFYK